MKIEQRIGRIHRIGQTQDVFIFNFCLKDSIEEYILRILHDKINMFELVVGEIETILGNVDDEFDEERNRHGYLVEASSKTRIRYSF